MHKETQKPSTNIRFSHYISATAPFPPVSAIQKVVGEREYEQGPTPALAAAETEAEADLAALAQRIPALGYLGLREPHPRLLVRVLARSASGPL